MLQCTNCNKQYEIRNGIFCLYPSSIDKEHLQEEESLAEMMKRTPFDKMEEFSSLQWKHSKDEFWDMVRNNVKGDNKVFINIGCGYDSNYMAYERVSAVCKWIENPGMRCKAGNSGNQIFGVYMLNKIADSIQLLQQDQVH